MRRRVGHPRAPPLPVEVAVLKDRRRLLESLLAQRRHWACVGEGVSSWPMVSPGRRGVCRCVADVALQRLG
eukprot:1711986-Pyramimonas_sp.AAC.2